MVTVSGKLNGSISGIVRATADHPFVDKSTNPYTLVSLPIEANITNGLFTIVVPQSQNLSDDPGIPTEGITYLWELLRNITEITYYLLDGTKYEGATHLHTDTFYYTGSIHDTSSRRLDRISNSKQLLITEPFHAIAPDLASIDFTSLMGTSPQMPFFSIGLYGILDLLTTNPIYKNRISSKLIIEGSYSSSATYSEGSVVAYNGNSYVWRNPSSGVNQTPPMTGNDANWVMIAKKGEPGGTGAVIVGYNPTTWNNSSEAAARGDVEDAIASIGTIDVNQYLRKTEAEGLYLTISAGAPKSNPTFTGTVKRSALTYPVAEAERPTEVPTAQYVEDAIASIGSGLFPKPIVYATISSHPSVDTNAPIIWDSAPINTGSPLSLSNGRFTPPETGSYIIGLMITLRAAAAYSANTKRMILRITFNRVSPSAIELGDFFKIDTGATTTSIDRRQFGMRYHASLDKAHTYETRALFDAYDTSIISQSIVGGVGNNYLLIWRVG